MSSHLRFKHGSKISRILGLLLLGLTSCTSSSQQFRLVKLPSGKDVKVMGVVPMRFSQGPPALMLKYQTDYKISDRSALRNEVDEIWSVFKTDVEKGNFTNAIISANEVPHGTLVKQSKGYNFVF